MPRISECGHIFCLSCVLRQMQVSRNCAICGAGPLMLEDLRPVRLELVTAPQPGQSWHFHLVQRSGDNVGLPGQLRIGSLPREGDPGWEFARRVRGNPEARLNFLHQELKGVEAADAEPCLKSAQALLQQQLTEALAAARSCEAEPGSTAGSDNQQVATVVFYQSSDGQLIFLEPSLTKQLLASFGSWGNLPHDIYLEPVKALRDVPVTSDLQWRHRFLEHLVVGGEVVFADGLPEFSGLQNGNRSAEAVDKTLLHGSSTSSHKGAARNRAGRAKGKGKGKGSGEKRPAAVDPLEKCKEASKACESRASEPTQAAALTPEDCRRQSASHAEAEADVTNLQPGTTASRQGNETEVVPPVATSELARDAWSDSD